MMPSPNRTFLRLLFYAFTAGSSLLIVGIFLLFAGAGSSIDNLRSVWCLIAPASLIDWAVHSSGFGTTFIGLSILFAAARTASRERTAAVELSSATRAARLRYIPNNVSAAASTVGVLDTLDVVEATNPFAFVYGWFRPRVCVSTGMVACLSDREIEAVLYHERWHLEQRDPIRLFVVRTVAAAFVFAPPIHREIRHFRLVSEIAADRHAVAMMGSGKWLAGALVKLVGAEEHSGSTPFLGLAEERVAALLGESALERDTCDPRVVLLLSAMAALLLIFILRDGMGAFTSAWMDHAC